jgi:hypothetical protein
MDRTLEYISTILERQKLRHEIHKFDSGAVMVDIWQDDLFYVVQIEDMKIGLSLITEDTGFDTIADKSYDDFNDFKTDFEEILKRAS